MKKTAFILGVFLLPLWMGCDSKKSSSAIITEQHTDPNGFKYETVTNDPTGLRLYTLDNGLKVYLAQNFKTPKIQTYIPVRAGSVYDPTDNTGLAHYLEHMVFKGTSKIGTTDYKKEKVLLQKISDLYEKHKAEPNPEKKLTIYKEIDKVSHEASKIAIANEYDKLVGSLGAEGTNAWTFHEETVYTNMIPSNELDKWLKLESERFSELVLRLFHTELEAVYEEFNSGQDSDFRRLYAVLMENLFPTHPYGQQTTIGKPEHLKNPSMEAIHAYYNKYYVPNNMAVILVGDLEFDSTIKKVNDTFGKLKGKEVTHPTRPTENPIKEIITKEIVGPEPENVTIAFRSKGVGSEDEKYLKLMDMILNNRSAGLIDLNLNQKQLVQNAECSSYFMNDYGMQQFNIYPKSGQSLEEAVSLMMEQIEKLKKGDFDDWLLEAVINDLKLTEIMGYEGIRNVAGKFLSAFIQFQKWEDKVKFLQELRKITKEDLVAFANKFYQNNYVVVYKKQGENNDLVKVPKPKITPNELNRDKSSAFLTAFNKMQSPDLSPKFVDYKSAIQNTSVNGITLDYIENTKNDFVSLNIIFDMGKQHNKILPLALDYLKYLGTDKLSAEALKKEFYKIGVEYYTTSDKISSTVSISGLRENIGKGLALLEDLWDNAKADQEAYNKYIEGIQKSRQNNKANKSSILWGGLANFATYGENSSLRDIYSYEELQAIQPEMLVRTIKDLKQYKHRIFYYGKDIAQAKTALNAHHKITSNLKDYPPKKEYTHLDTGNKVYFVNYDMVQAQLLLLAKGDTFDIKKLAAANVFNAYFGGGLSSILFQEIREARSLAYSAFSQYRSASEKGKPDYVYAFIGTQANKVPNAVAAMKELMTNMPEAQKQFEVAKDATLKKIASERINNAGIFWSYEEVKKRGIEYDYRKDIYEAVQKMTLADIKQFFEENIKNKNYTTLVVGNKKNIDMKSLSKLGKVEELDVDFLFNYKKK